MIPVGLLSIHAMLYDHAMTSEQPNASTSAASQQELNLQVLASDEPLLPANKDKIVKATALAAILMLRNSTQAFLNTGMEMLENEENEEENMIGICMAMGLKQVRHTIKRYIEDTVENYTGNEFQSHFRLRLETFEELENQLGPHLVRGPSTADAIPVRKQLLSVLWLLATPESYRSVADRFDMPKSSLHNCFVAVVTQLNKIASRVILWPTDQKKYAAKQACLRNGRFRECIGAIDGTFIEIKAPHQHPHVYTCRKAFYAIQLQVIALPDLALIDAFAGYPGSVGDRRVFTNSPIFKAVSANKGLYFSGPEYILGDKAYPILDWCVPPYINRGHMTEAQINFNTMHAKTRQVVERAFALLFGRFRRLKYLDMSRADLIPPTILASCVLHNLCLKHDDIQLRQEAISDGEAFMHDQRRRLAEEAPEVHALTHQQGHDFRNNLLTLIL